MQVSQTLSPTLGLRFKDYFSQSQNMADSAYLLGISRPWPSLTNINPQILPSYPHLLAQGSFALKQFIWHTLTNKENSNKNSKKVFWMTQLLTLEQAARQLSVSKRSVQRWIKEGRIETLRLSPGSIRIRDTALERFIDKLQRDQRLNQGDHRG